MDTPNVIQSIQENWSISATQSNNEIIPSSLLAGIPFSCLSSNLIAAIYSLSALTIGQRDRAHRLLNTYHQARMREGNYGTKDKGIFAILEVSDVEKACESARKMNRVMELQSFVPSPEKSVTGIDQRNHSTTHEVSLSLNLGASKELNQPEWDMMNSASNSTEPNAQLYQTSAMHDFDMLTPTTPYPDTEEAAINTPFRLIMAPPSTPRTQKRLSHLPRIQTSHPPSPTPGSSLPPVQSSFTPLFKHLKDEFSHVEAAQSSDAYLDGGLVHQQQESSMEAEVDVDLEARVRAVQQATYEFNLRLVEVRLRRREYDEARWRCEEARWRVERLREG